MGTSSSNYGPKGNTPLLPDWNDSDDNLDDQTDSNSDDKEGISKEDENTNNPLSGTWSGAKRTLGEFSKNPSKTSFNSAIKSYIKASGGVNGITKSARHGKIVSGNILSFLNGIQKNGIGSTYENLGFSPISGDSIEHVFNNLAEVLSSGGGTDEETIARNAVVEALAKIYEDFDLDNNSIESLDKLTEEQTENYLEYYLTSYIYERWLHELGVKIEEKDISSSEAVRVEENAFDFIQSSVNLKFDNLNLTTLDYNSKAGKRIINEIFSQAYSLIEAL